MNFELVVMSQRIRKVNELLREEVSKAISENLDRDDFVTVTAVETTEDLKHATVWVSILSDEGKTFEDLLSIQPEIQRRINEKLFMKFVPKLEFKIDHSQEAVARIEELLSDGRKNIKNS